MNNLHEKNKVDPYLEDGWYDIKVVTEMLEVFKNATTLLSGVYYPTSCLVLNQLFNGFKVRRGWIEKWFIYKYGETDEIKV